MYFLYKNSGFIFTYLVNNKFNINNMLDLFRYRNNDNENHDYIEYSDYNDRYKEERNK